MVWSVGEERVRRPTPDWTQYSLDISVSNRILLFNNIVAILTYHHGRFPFCEEMQGPEQPVDQVSCRQQGEDDRGLDSRTISSVLSMEEPDRCGSHLDPRW